MGNLSVSGESAPKEQAFLLDTNVLIHNPKAIESFGCSGKVDRRNIVVLSLDVLEELDRKKKDIGAVGVAARVAIRELERYRLLGNLSQGVIIEGSPAGGELLLIAVESSVAPPGLVDCVDNRLLGLCLSLMDRENRWSGSVSKLTLVTKDINLRVKANVLNIYAEDYLTDKVNVEELYTGQRVVEVSGEVINELYYGRELEVEPRRLGVDSQPSWARGLKPNELVCLVSNDGTAGSSVQSALGVVKKVNELEKSGDFLKLIPDRSKLMLGKGARNREQQMALELLLDPAVPLVTINGTLGTGKTFITLLGALHAVLDRKDYDQILIARKFVHHGVKEGFLPGPQPLDAKVLTPTGWKLMGDLQVGDYVIAHDGSPSKVLGVYPQGEKPILKLRTTDGDVECCEEHLWFTTTSENRKRKKPGSVKSAKEITQTLRNKFGKLNHHLPRNKPVHFDAIDLPLPPYTLGALLGNGSFGDSLSFSSPDKEVLERVGKELDCLNCELVYTSGVNYSVSSCGYQNKPARLFKITDVITNECWTYESIGIAEEKTGITRSTLRGRAESNLTYDNLKFEYVEGSAPRWSNPVKNILHKLGLIDCKASNKFIPKDYIYRACVADRIELLRGLMDTDGTVKKTGEASFCTVSEQLAKDVIELVKSLGGRATLRLRPVRYGERLINGRQIQGNHPSYEFTISLPEGINPFYQSRKAERFQCKYMHGVCIQDFEYVGTKECQCILIDHPEHLYVTDNYLVTHNTLDEKSEPWMKPFYACLDLILGGNKKDETKTGAKHSGGELPIKPHEYLVKTGVVRCEHLAYIRGVTYTNKFIIIDEAANLTPDEAKTIIGRAGEGTKVVFLGDIDQIDDPYLDASSNGLSYTIDCWKDEPEAGHITLEKCERSVLAKKASKIM